MHVLFNCYRLAREWYKPANVTSTDETVRFELWSPRFHELIPSRLPEVLPRRSLIGWALWNCMPSAQGTKTYEIILGRRDDHIVHYSVLISRNWRFPFMEPNDLQIGPVWTDPSLRGAGLQKAVMDLIMQRYAVPGRHFWMLCRPENRISNAMAVARGFALWGYVQRHIGFGQLLGRYQLCTIASSDYTGST